MVALILIGVFLFLLAIQIFCIKFSSGILGGRDDLKSAIAVFFALVGIGIVVSILMAILGSISVIFLFILPFVLFFAYVIVTAKILELSLFAAFGVLLISNLISGAIGYALGYILSGVLGVAANALDFLPYAKKAASTSTTTYDDSATFMDLQKLRRKLCACTNNRCKKEWSTKIRKIKLKNSELTDSQLMMMPKELLAIEKCSNPDPNEVETTSGDEHNMNNTSNIDDSAGKIKNSELLPTEPTKAAPPLSKPAHYEFKIISITDAPNYLGHPVEVTTLGGKKLQGILIKSSKIEIQLQETERLGEMVRFIKLNQIRSMRAYMKSE